MRRSLRMVAVLTFLTGSLTPVLIALAPGTASAGPCGTAAANCTMTGTLTVTAGTLTLTTSSSLTWADTLNGLNQSVADVVSADEQYTVNDATGTGNGWHVTMSATTFTNGSHTLPDSGTLVATGSVTSIAGTTAPTATCSGTCTLPTDSTTYPVAITTAASSPTPSTIYNSAANSGLGQVVLGGSSAANPAGWWLNIPANVYYGSAGVYTSTITMAVVSAP